MKRLQASTLAFAIAMSMTAPMALSQGPVFLTGHDPDFHAQGSAGARNLLNAGLGFVTNGTYNQDDGNKFLWVESRINPPGGHLIGENGLIAIGLSLGTHYERANAAELPAVNFSDYTAIAIASSFGGLLTRAELDVLIARSDEIKDYINAGGGLLALSECFPCGANLLSGGTPPDLYGFLPIDVSSIPPSPPFTITPFGAAPPFNLTNGDINDPTHNSFGLIGGLEPIDLDQATQATTLAGQVFVGTGLSQISLLPENATRAIGTTHDLTGHVFDGLGNPIAGVEVSFEVVSGPNAGDSGVDFTNIDGDAFFSYLGDGGAGIDGIEASFVDGSGTPQVSNLATCTWDDAECFLLLGDGPGSSSWNHLPASHSFGTQIDRVRQSWAVTLDDIPEFVIFDPRRGAPGGIPGLHSHSGYQLFAVQVMMWNPGVFPNNPEQCTRGLWMTVSPSGRVQSVPYGASDGGLTIQADTYWNSRGQRILRFPFGIPGF